MKIKISVMDDYQNNMNISIKNVQFKFKYNSESPDLYFDCPKKYEHIFHRCEAVFHTVKGPFNEVKQKKGQKTYWYVNPHELFRSSLVRLDFKYYELEERVRTNKVRFLVENIEYKHFGPVSRTYITKVLKKACNGILPKECPVFKKDPLYVKWLRAEKRGLLTEGKQYRTYKKYRVFFPQFGSISETVLKQIRPKVIVDSIESRAPI